MLKFRMMNFGLRFVCLDNTGCFSHLRHPAFSLKPEDTHSSTLQLFHFLFKPLRWFCCDCDDELPIGGEIQQRKSRVCVCGKRVDVNAV